MDIAQAYDSYVWGYNPTNYKMLDFERLADDIYEDKPLEYFEKDEYKAACAEISALVQEAQVVSIADISRALPQHQRIIFSVLDDLRVSGKVYWDEWRPLPTLIHAGDCRIPEKVYKHNWDNSRIRTWKHKTQDLGIIG